MPKTTTKPKEKTVAAKAVAPAVPYDLGFTLGADPEFTIIAGGKPVSAREMLQTFFTDATSDSVGYNFPGGNIGWDGHPATGELRPLPGSPAKVTANLKNLFEEAQKRMPFADLNTLTVASPTGGHIHLSVPKELNTMVTSRSKKMMAIERAMAAFMILPMLSENVISRETRKSNSGFGDIMNYRYDAKFTHPDGTPGYTMEIRALTAEWITTEKVTLGTLAYAAICWDNILKGNLKGVEDILFTSQRQASESVGPLLANFANFQKQYLNRVRPWVRMHPMYVEYREAIELVLNPERSHAAKKAAHYSISEGWGLARDSKSIKTADFHKEDEIETKTQMFPESIMRNISQFMWNDDVNVQSFATGLAKRCIGLGWKPTNEYFLFGLKKGMDSLIMRDQAGNFLSGIELMSTQEDYEVIRKKFERLSPKAEPNHYRFINPRTGEMADKDLKRVMIGLPYEMRQKMDMKALIKLVLKFEKNPKTMAIIDPKLLPSGPGKIKAAMDKEEAIEKGMEHAMAKADKLIPVPESAISTDSEMTATRDLVNNTQESTLPQFEHMDLTNLRNWTGSGTYGLFEASDLIAMMGRDTLERNPQLTPLIAPVDGMNPYMAWYGGAPNTIIRLGINWINAVSIMEDLMEVGAGEIEANYSNEYVRARYGRVSFSSSGSEGNLRNNLGGLSGRITRIMNSINMT